MAKNAATHLPTALPPYRSMRFFSSPASFGRPVRKKKEKTLGPATMPKHEAQQKLAEYIEEVPGKLIH
ncbi:MAG TPA: hypothetical protein VH640_06670 [Bryobacteraceae bacterium]|jgi:hypothetical protein